MSSQSAKSSSPALRAFEAQWLAAAPQAGTLPDPLADLRAEAMRRVLRLGLPTTRDETWRYTNLRHLTSRGFTQVPAAAGAEAAHSASPGIGAGAETVILVNGRSSPAAAAGSRLNGVEIKSLKNLSAADRASVAAHLGPLSDADQARWALLNTALFSDGLHLRITARLAAPLIIRHVLADGAGGAGSAAHPRVIIEAMPGTSAIIIEHHVGGGESGPLINSATHVAAGRDSKLEHYRIFATGAGAEHIDSLTVRQDAGSSFKQFTVAVGGALVRALLEADLNQPGASLDAHSLLVGHAARHVDCVNIAAHNARDTRSRQTARAIASGSSRVVFNSKVIVNAGAVHAESVQSCRGLLLSPTAEIDTRPQLEIHADEVKCAHGATTGRLDPDMLFYMLSRGLDRDTAQSLLVYAFLDDVLTGMSVASARSTIEEALIAQLPNREVLDKFR